MRLIQDSKKKILKSVQEFLNALRLRMNLFSSLNTSSQMNQRPYNRFSAKRHFIIG